MLTSKAKSMSIMKQSGPKEPTL